MEPNLDQRESISEELIAAFQGFVKQRVATTTGKIMETPSALRELLIQYTTPEPDDAATFTRAIRSLGNSALGNMAVREGATTEEFTIISSGINPQMLLPSEIAAIIKAKGGTNKLAIDALHDPVNGKPNFAIPIPDSPHTLNIFTKKISDTPPTYQPDLFSISVLTEIKPTDPKSKEPTQYPLAELFLEAVRNYQAQQLPTTHKPA